MSEKGQLEIQTRNIFPIIKQWLYSEREIFIRELVSNSMDAITKLKIISTSEDTVNDDEKYKVSVTLSEENKTITIEDNGIGMTKDELKKYLGQIAFSGAEDFISKYKSNDEQIIGHFGLGFYSAFMVSNKVDVDTLSWKENSEPILWSCKGDPEYSMDEGTRTTRGTTITLHINDEDKEYLDKWKMREILRRYCRFLPYELYLEDELINPDPPIWTKVAGELTDKDYKDFYSKLFPMDKEPLFWVHINADYPFKFQGVLYFPQFNQHDDLKSDKLHLYCNRVFVSSEMNALLPESLSYLRGFIDSQDIPLNVSRSFLQQDSKVRKISSFITKKVGDRLLELRSENEEEFLEIWKNISLYIKLAAIKDNKFYKRVSDAIIFEKSDGGWTSIQEVLKETYGENYKEEKEDEHHIYYYVPGETIDSLVKLYNDTSKIVIKAETPIDSHYFQYVESEFSDIKLHFKRIDSELGSELLDETPNQPVDNSGKTSKDRIEEKVKSFLDGKDIKLEWLKTTQIPLILIFPEFERRFREMTQSMMQQETDMFQHPQIIINLNHSLISRLDPMNKNHLNEETAKEVMTHLYSLALMPHKKLNAKETDNLFVSAGKLFSHIFVNPEEKTEENK